MKIKNIIITLACASLLVSCGTLNSNSYDAQDIGGVREVHEATVVAVEATKVNARASSGGTGLGATVGGLGGAILGGGNAKFATAAGGALLGGLSGNYLDKKMNADDAVELTLKVAGSKNHVSIVQRGKVNQYYVGQKGVLKAGHNTGSRFTPYSY